MDSRVRGSFYAALFMRFLALGTLDLMDSRVRGSYVLSGRRLSQVVLQASRFNLAEFRPTYGFPRSRLLLCGSFMRFLAC